MSLESTTEKTYLVYNYNYNMVSVQTRYDTFLIPAAQDGVPSSMPFSLSEIQQINNNSDVFKNGTLSFDEDEAADIYEFLRIRNWKSIITNEQAEEIFRNPTSEDLKRILAITDRKYFRRIYACFIGLYNSGFPISRNVDALMRERFIEFINKLPRKNIEIIDKSEDNNDNQKLDEVKAQNKLLQNQIEELQKMMSKIVGEETQVESANDSKSVTKQEAVVEKPIVKTTNKTNKKTTTKK